MAQLDEEKRKRRREFLKFIAQKTLDPTDMIGRIQQTVPPTKKFLVDRPAEGARVLREFAKEKLTMSVEDIERLSTPGVEDPSPIRQALQPLNPSRIRTGEVPIGDITSKVVTETVIEGVPLTPMEIASLIALGKIGKFGVTAFAAKFPRATKILKSDIKLPDFLNENPVVKTIRQLLPGGFKGPPELPVTPKGLPLTDDAAKRILEVRPPVESRDIFGQQVNKFNVSDDAKAIFNETSKIFKPQIEKAKRGKISFQETQQLADDLGMTFKDLTKFRGRAMNAEEILAAKGLNATSLNEVNVAKNSYLQNPTTENLVVLNQAISRHALVQASVKGASSEIGRALSIHRKLINPADIKQKNFETVLEAMGGRELTEEMAAKLAKIDPSDVAGLNKFVREYTEASFADKVYEYFINSILSNPITQVRNLISNASFLASKIPEKLVKGSLDLATSTITGKRTVFAGEAKGEAAAFFRAIPEATHRFLTTLKTGVPSNVAKLELNRVPAIKGSTGEIIRTPGRLLIAADDFAKAFVGRMERSALAYRAAKQMGLKGRAFTNKVAELEANPTDEMLKAIREEELLRTFQTRGGSLFKAFSGIRKLPAGRYIVPFLQTPANITSRALERSPLGFIDTAIKVSKNKGQKEIIESAGNALFGSAIAAAIAYYTLEGRIVGRPPTNPSERDAWFDSGKKPYSILMGDRWVPFGGGIEPLGLIMGATADTVTSAVEAGKDPDAKLVSAIVSSVPRYLLDKSFLTGLRDTFDGIARGEQGSRRLVSRFASAFIPFSGFQRFLAQNIDPVIRKPDTLLETLQTNIPGLSQRVKPRRNVFGEPIIRDSDLVSKVLRNLSVPASKIRNIPIRDEDISLERTTGFPSRVMGGVKLTGKEYDELLKQSGSFIKEQRKLLRSDPSWELKTDEEKRREIRSLENDMRFVGRFLIYDDVLKRITEEEQKKRDSAFKIPGISETQLQAIEKRREKFIEYGVRNFGFSPYELRTK